MFAAGTVIDFAGHLAGMRDAPSFRPHARVDGLARVDWFHVTAALNDPVVDGRRADPEGRSNRFGVLTVLGTNLVDKTKVRHARDGGRGWVPCG